MLNHFQKALATSVTAHLQSIALLIYSNMKQILKTAVNYVLVELSDRLIKKISIWN